MKDEKRKTYIFKERNPRYYLDFCHKYHLPLLSSESLPHFINELREKKQTSVQKAQAGKSIALFYQCVEQYPDIMLSLSPSPRLPQETRRGYDRQGLKSTPISKETLLKSTWLGQESWQDSENIRISIKAGLLNISQEKARCGCGYRKKQQVKNSETYIKWKRSKGSKCLF